MGHFKWSKIRRLLNTHLRRHFQTQVQPTAAASINWYQRSTTLVPPLVAITRLPTIVETHMHGMTYQTMLAFNSQCKKPRFFCALTVFLF